MSSYRLAHYLNYATYPSIPGIPEKFGKTVPISANPHFAFHVRMLLLSAAVFICEVWAVERRMCEFQTLASLDISYLLVLARTLAVAASLFLIGSAERRGARKVKCSTLPWYR